MVNFTFSSSVGWVEARNPTDIKCHERLELGFASLNPTLRGYFYKDSNIEPPFSRGQVLNKE